MKRRIGNLLLIGSLSLLASCGEINGGTSIAKPSVAPSTSTTPKPNENVTFSATLNLNGNPFYLTDPEIEAIWQITQLRYKLLLMMIQLLQLKD